MAGQGFQPGSAAVPCSQVEISVCCRNLRDKDAFSKSDPICVLFTYDLRTKQYHEFGRTEMIKDTLNPNFVQKFIMNYMFEESQKLKFEIYDVDAATSQLSAHDFLGRIECTLGEIVGCGSGSIERQLIGLQGGGGKKSFITVRVDEVSSSKEVVTLQMRASGLDKKDFLGKSDPFLIFYRANTDGSFTVVHKTEVIKNTLNPTWKPMNIPAKTLCSGDHNKLIKIECFDWDSDGSHDLIGEFTTTLKGLIDAAKTTSAFSVINPKKKAKKRNYKNSGETLVMMCKVEAVPSFLDYLHGGLELNFTVAIDFTASNGNPSQPSSLHYYSPHQKNQYAAAIEAVGEIIQDYDSDKLFPVLGFGAKLPDGRVSFEFPCNFNQNNPYCSGLPGIMQAYYTSLQQVQLYGPTNFSPIIQHVSRFASAKRDGSCYFVLLIITDGVISDMEHTINAIIDASQLPMSVIIVGVGPAEFDAMDRLDADGQRLSNGRRYAERDIVQFVPFRDFMGGGNMGLSQAALAKAVLAEVPDQVLYYMKKQGVKPNPNAPRKTAAPGPQPSGAGQPGQHPPGQYGGPGGAPGQQPAGQYGGPGGAPGQHPPGQAGQYGGPGGAPGQQPYGQPGAAPGGPPQGQGAPPYPQSSNVPPYPQAGGHGAAGYPQGAGQAPYPQGGAGGAPPYPATGGSNQPPYPQGQGGGSAPYPQAGGSAPYPQGQAGGSAPYPQGQAGVSAPYPQGQRGGSAPYPQGQAGGSAPYPQGQAGGSAPYPQGQAGGSAPYPQGQAGGSAPYPQGQAGGSAPYPQGQAVGSAPYPQGQAGGSAPYPQGQGGGSAPYPQGHAGGGSAPYPQGQSGYPGQGQQNSQGQAPPGRPPPPRHTQI